MKLFQKRKRKYYSFSVVQKDTLNIVFFDHRVFRTRRLCEKIASLQARNLGFSPLYFSIAIHEKEKD